MDTAPNRNLSKVSFVAIFDIWICCNNVPRVSFISKPYQLLPGKYFFNDPFYNLISDSFSITLGSFQGDSISAKLFTLYLAGALNHLRYISNIPNPPISSSLMPSQSQYADDCDYYYTNETFLKEERFPQIQDTFKE